MRRWRGWREVPVAAVDYAGIRDQLKTILEGDATLSGVRVFVEEEPQFGLSDQQKAIAVYMDRRTAAAADQNLSAGKRTRYMLRATLWTVFFSLESYKVACDGRDSVLGALELVLMANRTIGGKAASSYLDGGELISAQDASNGVFVAAGETILMMEVSAINT